jgi:hypothetical protein
MKTIRLIETKDVYWESGLGVYRFENHNKEIYLLTWEEVINLVAQAGYKYIPFYG